VSEAVADLKLKALALPVDGSTPVTLTTLPLPLREARPVAAAVAAPHAIVLLRPPAPMSVFALAPLERLPRRPARMAPGASAAWAAEKRVQLGERDFHRDGAGGGVNRPRRPPCRV